MTVTAITTFMTSTTLAIIIKVMKRTTLYHKIITAMILPINKDLNQINLYTSIHWCYAEDAEKKKRGKLDRKKNREKERREGEVRADKNDDMDGIGVTAPLETRHARGFGVGEGGGDTNFPLRPIFHTPVTLSESLLSPVLS